MKKNVENCRKYVSIFKDSKNKKLLVSFKRCKSPFCTYCSGIKKTELTLKLKNKNLNDFRFWTLTLKKTGNMEEDYKKINKCFTQLISRLKKNFCPKKKLEYLKMVEIGKSGNVHLHILINLYFDVFRLSTLWQDITGDSFVVEATRVKNKSVILQYIVKYFAKALDDVNEFFALKRRYSHSDYFFILEKKEKKENWDIVQNNGTIKMLYEDLKFLLSDTCFGYDVIFSFFAFNINAKLKAPAFDEYTQEHNPYLDKAWAISQDSSNVLSIDDCPF
jgi:hypothetical protein